MTLVANAVQYAYDAAPVLDDVSIEVESGDVLAVIGPSGAGKTTLLRLLALFDSPSRGRVAFDGIDVWSATERDRRAHRRRIGVVFQEARLFDGSVGRNVAFGLKVRRPWPRRLHRELRSVFGEPTAPAAVREALALVDLGEAVDRGASQLSGGEAQRVAFARAIAYDPDVLLLDEPTSELDPRNTAAIEAAIRAASDRGIGVVIATHDMHQAERVADRVAVMLDGYIIEDGETGAVFETPADVRTRRFIDGELVY